MEIVTKENYWIEILNDKSRYGQIETEDKNFNLIADDIWKVVSTTFIDTEDEIVVKNWEDITQLSGEGLTIFQRKVNVLFTLTEKNYVPMSIIRKLIENNASGKNYELEFDKENNKLIIHTDRVDDSKLEEISTTLSIILPTNIELVQYNHNIEISWKDINKYAECVSVDDLLTVNSDYKNDLTSEGEWIYPLSSLNNVVRVFSEVNKIKKAYFKLQKMTFSDSFAWNTPNLKYAKIEAPNITNPQSMLLDCYNLIEVEAIFPKATYAVNTFANCRKLQIANVKFPALNNSGDVFNGTQLEKNSVKCILESLPAYTSGLHGIKLGIHVDHQTDEEVLAAIANAEAKGWSLTVQWNGTATTAASMMSFGKLIYAKEGEMERPDGTTERVLDWGHYVTDETGYETFRSLKSAYEHFGLEMPTFEN